MRRACDRGAFKNTARVFQFLLFLDDLSDNGQRASCLEKFCPRIFGPLGARCRNASRSHCFFCEGSVTPTADVIYTFFDEAVCFKTYFVLFAPHAQAAMMDLNILVILLDLLSVPAATLVASLYRPKSNPSGRACANPQRLFHRRSSRVGRGRRAAVIGGPAAVRISMHGGLFVSCFVFTPPDAHGLRARIGHC